MDFEEYDDYFSFEEGEPEEVRKYLVVVIYDIRDNKRRNKLAKFLEGFGFRVQLSAFECILNLSQYKKLTERIGRFITDEDLLRVYRLAGNAEVKVWGKVGEIEDDDVIIV